jgi:hypothetical protein
MVISYRLSVNGKKQLLVAGFWLLVKDKNGSRFRVQRSGLKKQLLVAGYWFLVKNNSCWLQVPGFWYKKSSWFLVINCWLKLGFQVPCCELQKKIQCRCFHQ